MSTKSRISLFFSSIVMIFYFTIQSLLVFGLLEYSEIVGYLGYGCFLSFVPFFSIVVKEFIDKNRRTVKMNHYTKKLNDVLISQSHNQLFFKGIINEGAKDLTKEVTDSIGADRCSVWLYNQGKSSIVCQQLYVKSEYTWYQNIELLEKDFPKYFESLKVNPIIVANDAENHPSTSCFRDAYLIPLGIKSMLDVPIFYKDQVIGVICIESLSRREWCESEINFARMLSSLYSFAYSVKESNKQDKRMNDLANFIDESSIVSKTDSKGKITYVNKKFTEISGYTLDEVLGKDHNIVNSGIHPKETWKEMYKTVIKDRGVWNSVVTNKSKNGKLYHVDTYIKAEFDIDDNLIGFTSIRQDVTDIVQINDKLNSLVASQTSYVLRTDMQGRHTYWNQKFDDEFGWVYEGNMMHGDSLLSICESHHGAAYNAVKECVESPGKIIKVELDKPHRDGSRRTTLWEFVCITDRSGNPTEVQCMGIDITDRVKAEKKIIEVLKDVERKETDFRYRMNAINQSNMVIEFDTERNIKFANKNFCDFMGYEHNELVGKNHIIFADDDIVKSSEYIKLWDSLNAGHFISSEFRRKKKNGEEVWLQATYNPILDNDGKVISIMKIATDITDRINQSLEIDKKNTYLEHAAKILRHDMHSGINTYIPRGVNSLERRLKEEDIKNLKIEAPLKMIKEGLRHTQKVYKGVYEFTNLVKKDAVLEREEEDLKYILEDYLSSTAYKSQVDISDLGKCNVNEALFCTAIDNLIRNGLKYNDSNNKIVKISRSGNIIYVEDNGRGLTSEEFKILSKPYTRKEGQKETGTGLGLNICISILKEHGFSVDCEKKPDGGSRIEIRLGK